MPAPRNDTKSLTQRLNRLRKQSGGIDKINTVLRTLARQSYILSSLDGDCDFERDPNEPKAFYLGVVRPLAEWAELARVPLIELNLRLAKGQTLHEALTTPHPLGAERSLGQQDMAVERARMLFELLAEKEGAQ